MSKDVHIIASSESWIDQQAIDQLNQTASLEGIERAVGLPDLHAGRGIPIGAAFWSRSYVYPHLVGNDIGCGMAFWQTDLPERKFKLDKVVKQLTDLEAPWGGDHHSRLADANLPTELDGETLGTIGGGNHFAEFQRVDSILNEAVFRDHGFDHQRILLLVHSGSRGLGQAILQEHIRQFNTQGLDVQSGAFHAYRGKHDQAMRWAELNRNIIAERFLGRLGSEADRKLDIFHNSVTPHEGGWLHRKGAAPSDKGLVVIPGSRGTMTYLVSPKTEGADLALYSLAHGAGRKWTRGDAKAKLGKRFKLSELERTDLGGRVICEDRNLIFEEAPQAYKNIERVIDDLAQAGLIEVVAILRPIVTYKTRRR
ncbi:MAG: RNA ligase RtcB family protein [Parasphingorhabdus sp.]|uniref:RNA ligase RtcB family protein n=1 Tax=Parasphingorhabdus sp. TaxID=2709688 RepID=UPI003264944C